MTWEDKTEIIVVVLMIIWLLCVTPKGKDIFYD